MPPPAKFSTSTPGWTSFPLAMKRFSSSLPNVDRFISSFVGLIKSEFSCQLIEIRAHKSAARVLARQGTKSKRKISTLSSADSSFDTKIGFSELWWQGHICQTAWPAFSPFLWTHFVILFGLYYKVRGFWRKCNDIKSFLFVLCSHMGSLVDIISLSEFVIEMWYKKNMNYTIFILDYSIIIWLTFRSLFWFSNFIILLNLLTLQYFIFHWQELSRRCTKYFRDVFPQILLSFSCLLVRSFWPSLQPTSSSSAALTG